MSNDSPSSSKGLKASQNRRIYEFEGLQLDSSQYRLRRLVDGGTVHLTGRAFEALCLLVENHGQLVDKATLLKTLWPTVIVEEGNLTTAIYSLRQALGEKPGEHRFIATVPGRGYRFVAEVREVAPVVGASSPPAESNEVVPKEMLTEGSVAPVAASGAVVPTAPANTSSNDDGQAPKPSPLYLATAVVVALALIGSVFWGLRHRAPEHISAAPALTPTPAPALAGAVAAAVPAPRTAVAVLPFVNLTGDASKEYLADGMAEQLIDTLAKMPGLKVPARTSTFAYKGRNTDIRQIARDLGVGSVVEGSVRAAGKRIRVTAQLVGAQDGMHLWSGSYDEEFTDLFKLQDRLATQIATALQPNLSEVAQTAVIQARPTKDVEAYNLSLQAWALLGSSEEPKIRQALIWFQQAIARDPKFARAYAGLSAVHGLLAGFGNEVEETAMAQRAAEQALALDPDLDFGHAQLAGLALQQGRLLDMEAQGSQASALGPNDPPMHTFRGYFLLVSGHLRASQEEVQKAYELAPADVGAVATTAQLEVYAGHDAEANRLLDVAIGMGAQETSTSAVLVVRAYEALRAKRFLEAGSLFSKQIDPRMGPEAARTAEVYQLVFAAMADPKRRDAALEARSRLYPKPVRQLPKLSTAGLCLSSGWAYALMGELDTAYDLTNQCLDQSVPGKTLIDFWYWDLWTPEMRAFRRDERFQLLAARLGLLDLWRRYGPPDECDLKDQRLTCH
jgi:TolB-like protein/DNA-binding winged helix-turn-helix (wHTH) protein